MSTDEPRARRRSDVRAARSPLIPDPPDGPLPPVDAAGFMRVLELAIGTARTLRRHLSLVAVELVPVTNAAIAEVTRALRRTIRDTDGIWRATDDRLVVLLADAGGPLGAPAFSRIVEVLGDVRRAELRVGWSSLGPGMSANWLLSLATDNLDSVPRGA